MAVNEWLGNVAAVAQVETVTYATNASGAGAATYTINNKVVSVPIANGDTPAAVAAAVATALQASEITEFQEWEWGYPGTGAVITATFKTPGQPGVFAAADTAAGMTTTQTLVTAATGPNDAAAGGNWSQGSKPGAGDEVEIRRGPGLFYNLGTIFSAAPNSVRHFATHTAGIGLPVINTTGGGDGYREFRDTHAAFGATPEVWVGDGIGAGPDIFQFTIDGARKVYVRRAGAEQADGSPAVDVSAVNNAGVEIYAFGGAVGYGYNKVTVLKAALVSTAGDDTAFYGYGPIDDMKLNGAGQAITRGPVDDTYMTGTPVWVHEDGDLVGIHATGGVARLTHKQAGALLVEMQGVGNSDPPVLDLSTNTLGARGIANTSYFRGGAYVLDPYFTADFTTVEFDRASFQASDVGDRFKITRAAV